jgi:hypothetical protein
MDKKYLFATVALILLSAGIFQIVAALTAVLLWYAAGDWRPYWPQIAVIAFWITLPVSFLIWKRYRQLRLPKS